MTFLFDENISARLALAFRELGEPVAHVTRIAELGVGAPDEEVLHYAGPRGILLVTRDVNIYRKPHLRAAASAEGVGVYAIASGKSRVELWDLVRLLVNRWPEMLAHAGSSKPPFMVEVPPKGALKPLAGKHRHR